MNKLILFLLLCFVGCSHPPMKKHKKYTIVYKTNTAPKDGLDHSMNNAEGFQTDDPEYRACVRGKCFQCPPNTRHYHATREKNFKKTPVCISMDGAGVFDAIPVKK